MKKMIISFILSISMCLFIVSCREDVKKSETETRETIGKNDQVSNSENENENAKKIAEETKKASEDALNKAKQMVEEIKKE